MKKTFVVFTVVLITLLSVTALAKTKIEFWHAMGGWRIELLQSMTDDFMAANPDIEVVSQYAGSYNDLWTKFSAALKGGNVPNVVQLYDLMQQGVVDAGVMIPAQTMIDKDPDFNAGALLAPVKNYYTLNGVLNAVPFNTSTPIVFYNKTMFEKAGLDPNMPPETFEDFLKFGGKLLAKDDKGNITQTALTIPFGSWFLEGFLARQNATWVNNDNGRSERPTASTFNTPEAIAALNWWKQMTDEELIINTKRDDWSTARQLFQTQKVAMLMSSTSDVAIMEKSAKENGFELGTAFLPRSEKSVAGSIMIGGAALYMPDGQKKAELDASWKFIKFMVSKEQQIRWHKETGYFPVLTDAITDLMHNGYYVECPNHLTALMQLILAEQTPATAGAVLGCANEVRNYMVEAMEKTINGELEAEEALMAADKKSTEAIKEYNELY